MVQSISEVMTRRPVTLPGSATVRQAAEAMDRADIGNVLVVNEADVVRGIVTDRDITVRVVAEGRDPADTRLSEICSDEILTLTPKDTVDQAVRLMQQQAIRRLPVVDGGRAAGIVTLGDLAVTQDPDSALADISAAPADE